MFKYGKIRKTIEDRGGFILTIRGYEVRVTKTGGSLQQQQPPALSVTTASKSNLKLDVNCDFCQGQPITLAGTKEPIPCPKCSKRANAI